MNFEYKKISQQFLSLNGVGNQCNASPFHYVKIFITLKNQSKKILYNLAIKLHCKDKILKQSWIEISILLPSTLHIFLDPLLPSANTRGGVDPSLDD